MAASETPSAIDVFSSEMLPTLDTELNTARRSEVVDGRETNATLLGDLINPCFTPSSDQSLPQRCQATTKHLPQNSTPNYPTRRRELPTNRSSLAGGVLEVLGTESVHPLCLQGLEKSITITLKAKIEGFSRSPTSGPGVLTYHGKDDLRLSLAYSVATPDLSDSDQALLDAGISLNHHGRQESVSGFKVTVRALVDRCENLIDLTYKFSGCRLPLGLSCLLPGGIVHCANRPAEHDASTTGDLQHGTVLNLEGVKFKSWKGRCKYQTTCSLVMEGYAVVDRKSGNEDVLVAVAKSPPFVFQGADRRFYLSSVGQDECSPSGISMTATHIETAPKTLVANLQHADDLEYEVYETKE